MDVSKYVVPVTGDRFRNNVPPTSVTVLISGARNFQETKRLGRIRKKPH